MKMIFNRIKTFGLKYPKYSYAIFFLFIVLISYYYNYHHILTLRPQSVHNWRQADCASQALNYYQNGMHFFKPELHNMIADNGTSGYCVEEFPIFFYTVAIFYKIFGFHELIFRLLNTLVFICGLYALFKIVNKFTNNLFWSIFTSILFFTAPVLVYYANNFLINTTGFAFTIMGWYFFVRFYYNSKNINLYVSLMFFTIASVIKYSEAISIIALNGIFFLELIGLFKFKSEKKIFYQGLKQYLPFILAYFLIGLWLLFVFNYNYAHKQTHYYFSNIKSYFDLSKLEISQIWYTIKIKWLKDYFSKYVLFLFIFMFLTIILFIRRTNYFLTAITMILFIGTLLYCIIGFSAFLHEDYYMICIYIFPIFLVITFIELLNRNLKKIFNSIIFKALITIFLVFNILYAKERLTYRYSKDINEYYWRKDIHNITSYLRALGIERSDKVIYFNDLSPNYSLYLMNQKGWTNYNNPGLTEEGIDNFISLGAKYLIIDDNELLSKDHFKKYIKNEVGNYKSIHIFKL